MVDETVDGLGQDEDDTRPSLDPEPTDGDEEEDAPLVPDGKPLAGQEQG